jgi:hypothetical protein
VLAWVSESGLARLLKQAYQRSLSSGPFVLPYDSLDNLWDFILRHRLTFAILGRMLCLGELEEGQRTSYCVLSTTNQQLVLSDLTM